MCSKYLSLNTAAFPLILYKWLEFTTFYAVELQITRAGFNKQKIPNTKSNSLQHINCLIVILG